MYFEAFVAGHQPYTYRGCPYYKVESTTTRMPREMFEERVRTNKPRLFAWENQPAENISIADLNEERIRGALRLGFEKGRVPASSLTEPLNIVLEKLELLNNGQPNNAAAAIFATTTRNYPQFRMRMARFRGIDKNEFIDNQRVDGNFFDLLDAGMAFFLKHLSMSGKIVGFRREEHLEVPAEALREALTNALCHRQFEKYNLTPSIAVFDDRIEIENPGILPPQITAESIKLSHSSYPYNPIIADVLFKTTFLENWGTGVRRIIDICTQYAVPEPVWSIDGGYVCVTFKRSKHHPNNDPSTTQVTTQVRPKYDPSCDQVKKLILSINDEYMAVENIMGLCGVKSRKWFRINYILPACEENAIERKYPDNPNHPQQQYRLTDKAKEWKETMERYINNVK
ncbi:MAG: ATP-dependent DNA helicase RecG, partial [Bacteroidales bacterium]|nr:ATP-dependent DNA helicase RecG [Bacteroidales bacterium]